MKKVTALLVFGSNLIGVPVTAKNDCPTEIPGSAHPWAINQVLPGDRSAEVYIDVDKAGEPTGCRLGKTNIPTDERFNICMAFIRHYRINPDAPGISLPTTVMKLYVEYGDKHERAEKEARKSYFAQHPEIRPDCYRDGD